MNFRIWKWRYQSKSTITLNFLSDILSKLDTFQDELDEIKEKIDNIEKHEVADNSEIAEALRDAQKELKEKNTFVEGLVLSLIERRYQAPNSAASTDNKATGMTALEKYIAKKNGAAIAK